MPEAQPPFFTKDINFPQEILTHRTKGIPGGTAPFAVEEIAAKRWNLMAGDLPLPVAVIEEEALANNAAWMRAFCATQHVSLAPHGKTTMAPKLFRRQIADGAWAMTLSTAHQVQVARDFGVSRILVANQVVDPRFLAYLLDELDRDPDFDVLVLADSIEGVRLAGEIWKQGRHRRPLGMLVEVGAMGGRTGVRSLEEAISLARHIASCAGAVQLRGFEGFEGIFSGPPESQTARVDALLDAVIEVAEACDREELIAGETILSAGGSAFFDRVVAKFRAARLRQLPRVVLRSGCYIAHDSRMHAAYFDALSQRVPDNSLPQGELRPALQVLARVQSRPEPGLCLLTAGKRDLSYDVHMPLPEKVYRPGRDATLIALEACEIYALADQHAFMRVPEEADLAVGDIVSLGVSHPCTTFDKWDVLYGVNAEYDVVEAYKTYF